MAETDCTDILKALADRTRQRIVKALADGAMSVNELSEELEISQYNTSKHLGVLKRAGIVDVQAAAQRREYFIAEAFRKKMQKEGATLDFGCCTFRLDQLLT
jgi:DNA-binding transcriptional ArsR family regulator